MDDLVELAVQRIVVAHLRRPAQPGLGQRVDQHAGRMRLAREERAVEHRRLEHRDLQPREQRLDAVGKVPGLEDEVEQHRDHLDGHRFELVRLLPERRFLQVAQDVLHPGRDAGELDRTVAEVEAGFAGLQPCEALAQHRGRDDRCAGDVTRRRRRQRSRRNVARRHHRPRAAELDRRELERTLAVAGRRPAGRRLARHPERWLRRRAARRHPERRDRRAARGRRELRHRRLAAGEHPPEHRHHVDFGRRRRLPGVGPGRGAALTLAAPGIDDRGARTGHDVELHQVLVEVLVDRVQVGQRALVEFLQDLELDPFLALLRLQRIREGGDDALGRERIAVGLQVRPAHQVADAAIERLQLVVAEVLDDARDVAGDHRLVHHLGVDERQVADVDLGEVRLGLLLAGDLLVDALTEPALELRHQRLAFGRQGRAGVQEQLLLVADVGATGAVHQHFADLVQDRRERREQACHREIPAVAEDLRGVARRRPSAGCLGGRGVHVGVVHGRPGGHPRHPVAARTSGPQLHGSPGTSKMPDEPPLTDCSTARKPLPTRRNAAGQRESSAQARSRRL